MNRAPDALVGPAAADVTRHRRVNVGVGRLRLCRKQGRGRHDLPRLAVAALRNFLGDPGLLQRVVAAVRETFDGGDFLAFHGFNRRDARTDWVTVDMDGASAALRDAAAELGAGQAEVFTERPEQRSVGIDVDLVLLPFAMIGIMYPSLFYSVNATGSVAELFPITGLT